MYEINFEAENLVGLKTQVKDGVNNYILATTFNTELSSENKLPFTLEPGSLFEYPLNLTSSSNTNIILRTNTNPKVSSIYQFQDSSFILVDSLQDKIVKDFGDFNNNGLTDLLTYFVRDGYIDEQTSQNSTSFNQKYANTGGNFWPILAKDIDADGITEVLSVFNDSTIDVWEVQSDLSLTKIVSLSNFTPAKYGGNIINSPNAVIADIDGDGVNEIWMVDQDGDIFSYKITGNNQFVQQYLIPTEFLGSSAFLTSGDFDGDGKDELAVMLHSRDEFGYCAVL